MNFEIFAVLKRSWQYFVYLMDFMLTRLVNFHLKKIARKLTFEPFLKTSNFKLKNFWDWFHFSNFILALQIIHFILHSLGFSFPQQCSPVISYTSEQVIKNRTNKKLSCIRKNHSENVQQFIMIIINFLFTLN